jgi:Na+/proline symporter
MVNQNDKSLLLQVMIFYSLLSFFIAPAIGYHFNKTRNGITYGMLFGILLSIILWYSYALKKLELQ